MRTTGRYIVAMFVACVATATFAMSFPEPIGFVNDYVGMLDVTQRSTLESKLKALAEKDGPEIAVAIVPDLNGLVVEDYSIQLFKEWKIGKAGRDNGILFLFAPNEKKVRIEVGYGVEYILPDVVAKRIINEIVVPKYRAGDKVGAVSAGVDAIIGQLNQEPLPATQAQQSSSNIGLVVLVILLVFGGAIIVFALTSATDYPVQNKSNRRRRRRYTDDYPFVPNSYESSSRRRDRDSDDGFTAGVVAGSVFSSRDDSSNNNGGGFGGGFDGFGGGDAGGGGASGDL